MKQIVSFLLLLALPLCQAVAVEVNGGYQTTAPTDSNITNWSSGWGASGITGWDFVGNVNGASGVYIGNGWVLTAGHVGPGNFTLQGTTYTAVNGSALTLTDTNGTADLTMFQIASAPALPLLPIATTAPTPFSNFNAGTSVVMLGFGGGQGETWGENTVTTTNLLVQITSYGTTFNTIDFKTAFGTTTAGRSRVTNTAQFIAGDSGGGDFNYDTSSGRWKLVGINEATDANNNAYMVDLSHYAAQINKAVPVVPDPRILTLFGITVAWLFARKIQGKPADAQNQGSRI